MCVKPQVLVGGEDGARLPPPPPTPKPLPCDGSGLGAMFEPEQKPGSCERGAESQERRTSGPRLVHQPGPQPACLPGPRGRCLSEAPSAARRGKYWEGLSGPEASPSHQRSGEEPPPPRHIQPVGCGHAWSNAVSSLWKKSFILYR